MYSPQGQLALQTMIDGQFDDKVADELLTSLTAAIQATPTEQLFAAVLRELLRRTSEATER